jgi:D-ribose pyranase
VLYADLARDYNRPLLDRLEELFQGTGADLEAIPNDQMLSDIAHNAKVIVRTGAFNPWGNIAMICGTVPHEWFQILGTVMPESYRQRRDRMRAS